MNQKMKRKKEKGDMALKTCPMTTLAEGPKVRVNSRAGGLCNAAHAPGSTRTFDISRPNHLILDTGGQVRLNFYFPVADSGNTSLKYELLRLPNIKISRTSAKFLAQIKGP